MLKITTNREEILKCKNDLTNYFTQTMDYSLEELMDDSIKVITNDDNTFWAVMRLEDGICHYDFVLVEESLRGQGLGTKCTAEVISIMEEYHYPIRCTVRCSNIKSYQHFLTNGFKVTNVVTVGDELGVEMYYNYPKVLEPNDFECHKPSSCGLVVLSALAKLKYNKDISPDDIPVPCIKDFGISKEGMFRALQIIFKEDTMKVVSNISMDTDASYHLFETWMTQSNKFAIVYVLEDNVWPHWILVTDSNDKFIYTFDSIRGNACYTREQFFTKAVMGGLFMILV